MTELSEVCRTAKQVLDAIGTGAPVAVIGSINVDLTVETARLPKPGETVVGGELATLPGGKSANQAITCALLGSQTSLIGALGKDSYGDLLHQSLSESGVDLRGVARVEQPSGSTLITVDAAGENTIVYSAGANATVNAETVKAQAKLIGEARVLGLCLEAPLDAVVAGVRLAREHGVKTVLNFSPITEVPDELLDLVDVLIVNQHELSNLSGRDISGEDLDQAREALEDLGFTRAVLTLGGDGAMVWEDGEFTHVPAFPVFVVDTTGSGDAFMGALLSSLAAGKTLREGACLAAAVAGLAATRKGAQSSYRSAREVREILDKNW